MNNILFSIIIPTYNSANYLFETITSIINQSYQNIEIIIIDDGSTDDTKKLIDKIIDTRLQYFYQENQGVSRARNKGLSLIKGQYVCFFDADDIMSDNFIESRLEYLKKNQSVQILCGEVIKFSTDGEFGEYYRGPSNDINEEILLYEKSVITCPSNFIIQTAFLTQYNLKFNEKLSSTADRFFLLDCSKYCRVKFEKDLPKLYYRISNHSMSNQLTEKLIIDNEIFYFELIKSNLIPRSINKQSLFLGYYILFASYFKIYAFRKGIIFGLKAFMLNPIAFVIKLLKIQ